MTTSRSGPVSYIPIKIPTKIHFEWQLQLLLLGLVPFSVGKETDSVM
jgi:hypothetical protein